ncbi:MAG: permease [bacterium]|nr:permease [bacterium]
MPSAMIRDALWLFAELLVLFVGVSFGLALLRRRLGDERLRSLMGATPITAALRGIAIGFITPFCTYSAVPVLVSLRQAGVTPAGYVAFIVAAPVLDPILFGALAIIVGLPAALIYLGVAFAAALLLALLAEKVDLDRFMKPLATGAGGPLSGTGSLEQTPWQGLRLEWRPAMRASRALLRTMLPLLVLGIAIGMAITAFLPPETVARVPGLTSQAAIPAAAVAGILFYINTELFVPIADALGSAGIGVGAIVALTIAGAGANVPEFVILARLTTRRVLAAFGGYVLAVAIAGGLLVQFLVA